MLRVYEALITIGDCLEPKVRMLTRLSHPPPRIHLRTCMGTGCCYERTTFAFFIQIYRLNLEKKLNVLPKKLTQIFTSQKKNDLIY